MSVDFAIQEDPNECKACGSLECCGLDDEYIELEELYRLQGIETKKLREALVSKSKTINYCIGHIHGVSQLKYIEQLCRNTEKVLESTK